MTANITAVIKRAQRVCILTQSVNQSLSASTNYAVQVTNE